ncbi:MAG: bifunctional nuclease family protein [Gemmatimonadetes bacterium]|nr:bifunctional nuclease family protein [Gemmatimonadota bacterium]
MKEVRVASLGLDKTSNTPVVILQEKDGERVLPIWIGPSEASAIAMELAGMKFSRPLTHDLFSSLVKGLGSEVQRVIITKVVENTYYAELILNRAGEIISIDARPSDSIAIALRSKAPIYARDELLEVTAIEIAPAEAGDSEGPAAPESQEREELRGMGPEELKEYLKKLNPEDFGRFNP